MARSITTTRKPAQRRSARSSRRSSSSRTTRRYSTHRRSPRPGIKRHATIQRSRKGQKDIQAFLDRFTACLTAGDGQGAAACFEYPAFMVMANAEQYGKNQPFVDPQVVAGFFDRAPQMYHDRGIETTFADIQGIDWLADDLALVRTFFPYIDADGNDMGDGETSLYAIRRNDDGLAICAAIALGTRGDRASFKRRRPRGDVGDHRE